MQTAAQSLGLELRIVNASTEREIDAAFANLAEQRLKALIVTADAFFSGRRDQLVSLAARHALPTMYWLREFAADGGNEPPASIVITRFSPFLRAQPPA